MHRSQLINVASKRKQCNGHGPNHKQLRYKEIKQECKGALFYT